MAQTQANVLDGRLYIGLQRFADGVLLSVVWAVACVPLVTAFPATAALFGVVRARWREDERPAVAMFVRLLRENLRQAVAFQVLLLGVAAAAAANILLAAQLPAGAGDALLGLVVVALVVVAAASVYVFPLMVSYATPFPQLLRSSVLLALGRPATTLACLAVLAAAGLLAYVFPLAPLLAAAPVAAVVYRWCARVFEQAAAR